MNFLGEILDQGRRIAVDVLNSRSIEHDAPFSPEVPDDLTNWLPDLFDRFPVVLPWQKPQSADPAVHDVWILDNTAYRSPQDRDQRPELPPLKDPEVAQPAKVIGPGNTTEPAQVTDRSGWEAEVIACYFIKNSGRDPSTVIAHLATLLNVHDDDVASKKRIADRLRPFLETVLPNHTLRVSIDSKEEQTLGPSNYSGISGALHALHFSPQVPSHINLSAASVPPPFSLPGTTVVAEESGWGVISDIDDTIKVTMTPSALGILRSTFIVETPEVITGMPELYARMADILHTPPFFYLSASPYNLYPFLRRFREAHYPHGTIMLRDASWQNLGGLISSLRQNVQEYKVNRMHKIHSWFPHRRFVCLGDSTQSDPESYGEMARTFPGWVRAIFIRKVTDIAEMDIKTKNAPERFEKAFKGLDRRLWHVFTDPSELQERVSELSRDPDALVSGP